MLTHCNLAAQAPSRVVVLGAHGFLAARLIRTLRSDGISCCVVGSADVDLIAPDAAAKLHAILRPGDSVVMTAALTPEKGRDRAAFLKNVAMVDNLCACLAASTCAHIVYISSDSVYNSRDNHLNEETCCESNDLYALAHIVREKLLAECCFGAGIPLAIIRPCAIYGAGDTHDSYGPNRFLRTGLGEGTITLFGEGEEERDHVYIDDVARILQNCLLHRSTGVVNAVSGTPVPFHDVASTIAAAIGKSIAIVTAPRRVPIFHKRFDPAQLLQAFPDFVPTPLDKGIQKTLAELSDGQAGLADSCVIIGQT